MESMAKGGMMMGAPKGIMQVCGTKDQIDRRPMDPQRDILQFFKYMIDAMAREIYLNGSVPAFREAATEVGRDKIDQAYARVLELLKDSRVKQYDDLAGQWLQVADPQAVDILLRLFGRAILQFYVECYYQVRDNRMLDGDLCGTIDRIMANMPSMRPSLFKRIARWFKGKFPQPAAPNDQQA
jgi:glutathione S-transferase